MNWREWKPGLDSNKTLQQVLSEMPRTEPGKIPFMVRLLENPKSILAFPGAVTLERHDCLHPILCASFHNDDEALVIGFTMGTELWLPRWMLKLFMWLTTWAYPKNYRWTKGNLRQFARGYLLAQRCDLKCLSHIPFEKMTHWKLHELRRFIGISWLNTEEDYQVWSRRWKPDRFIYRKKKTND